MKKAQLDQFNAIKGLSIYLVVCIHFVYSFFSTDSKPLLFEMYNYFTGLAVPFFLILGGFFFARRYLKDNKIFSYQDFAKAVKNLCLRIIVPYYIFATLLTVYNMSTDRNICWQQFLFIDSRGNGLYFLIIYAYSVIFSLVLLKIFQYALSKKKITFMIPLVSLLLFPLSNYLHDIYSQNGIILALPLIAFFSFGMPLFLLSEKIDDKYNERRLLLIGKLFVIISIFTFILYCARKYYGNFPVFTSPPTIYSMVYCLLFF